MTGCSLYHRLRKGMVQMTIREGLERWEKEYLSPFATLSMDSQGRERNEEQCDIRPVFQRLNDFLAIHQRSLDMVQAVIDAIGPEDAEQFVRICEKFLHAEIQI